MKFVLILGVLLKVFNFSLHSGLAAEVIKTPHATVTLLSEKEAVTADGPHYFLIQFNLSPGWHIYGKDPGPTGLPPRADFSNTVGGSFSELEFPEPIKIVSKNQISYGYEKSVNLFTKFTPNEHLKNEKDLKVILNLKWLICKTECVPEKGSIELNLPVVSTEKYIHISSTNEELFRVKSKNDHKSEIIEVTAPKKTEIKSSLLLMILFSFIGGFILNFMPCVLPVLSLKILGLLKESNSKKGGIFYTAGVLVSFLSLALLILFLKSTGSSVGWGFQLQNPFFNFFLTTFFFILGLNLLGFFEWSGRFMGVGSGLASQSGWSGSFFTGVLTTVAATPCSAPFMGTALGFALSQSTGVVLVIFFFLGLGLASPFLVISFIPSVSKWLPRPGHWMITFKEFLSFPLFGTSLWLLTILYSQAGFKSVVITLEIFMMIVFGIWSFRKNKSLKILALFIVCSISFYEFKNYKITDFNKNGEINSLKKPWKKWNREEMNAAISSGKKVFIDTTAEWCVSCKANEAAIFSDPKVIESLSETDTVAFIADWTNGEEEVTKLLEEHGRNSVPAYFLFKNKNTTPVILPQVFTVESFLSYFK